MHGWLVAILNLLGMGGGTVESTAGSVSGVWTPPTTTGSWTPPSNPTGTWESPSTTGTWSPPE